MPNITVTATVLGLHSNAYDFKNDRGEQVKGVSHTLRLYDFSANELTEVKVPQDRLGLVADLQPGDLARLSVGVGANNNRARFTLQALVGAEPEHTFKMNAA